MRIWFAALTFILLHAGFGASAGGPVCRQTHAIAYRADVELVDQLYRDHRIQEAIWMLERLGKLAEAHEMRKRLENEIETAPIQIIKQLEGWGFVSEVYVVEIGDGIKGIFKPEFQFWKKRNPLLRDSTNLENEVTIYEMAREVGIPVPATTIRTVDGMRGSLQVFVSMGEVPHRETRTYELARDQRLALAPFDFLIDHQDRWMPGHGEKNFVHYYVGNYFLNAYIDNSTTLGAKGRFAMTYSTVQPSQPMTRQMIERILRVLTDDKIRAIVGRRHSEDVILATIQRRNSLAEMLAQYRAKNGPKP